MSEKFLNISIFCNKFCWLMCSALLQANVSIIWATDRATNELITALENCDGISSP